MTEQIKKFSLLKEEQTIATDNTLPIESAKELHEKIYKDIYLNKIVWMLDRDVWAKVEAHEATQSWGREQSGKLILEYAAIKTSETHEKVKQLVGLAERCEKTFGKINEIFTLLKSNSDSNALVKLVDAIDVDIPLIQAMIKDELQKLTT